MTAARHALMIAERLLDPGRVVATVPGRPSACLQSLAGTALLHARLALVDEQFESAAAAHWATATTHGPKPREGGPGVFAAPGGMAASLILGQPYLNDPEPHRPAVLQAVRWLSAQAGIKASDVGERLHHGIPLTWTDYDAVTGLAGIGRVLLAALSHGHQDAESGLLASLSTITALINRPGMRPGWWLPAAGHPASADVPPSGRADTGMAHGIAGPLALLAYAASQGWTVKGQPAAIASANTWLLTWKDPRSLTWPPYVSGDDLNHANPPLSFGRRDAWCYGAPGIGRALTAAAHATRTSAAPAATAFATQAERPVDQWDTKGPALCHGHAGVLQCATGCPGLAANAEAGVNSALDPAALFGLGHIDDDPGLLTGAAGIALALADRGGLPTNAPPTRWDALLLLS